MSSIIASNFTSNAALPILCPLDNRRSQTEHYVKLVAVHLTVTAATCYLLSIRGEQILTWKSVFWFKTPFIMIAQHAVALTGTFVSSCYSAMRKDRTFVENVMFSLRWLFETVPNMNC